MVHHHTHYLVNLERYVHEDNQENTKSRCIFTLIMCPLYRSFERLYLNLPLIINISIHKNLVKIVQITFVKCVLYHFLKRRRNGKFV